MKLNALLVDPSVLGDEGWPYLERVCGMLPDLGIVVCSGRSTVAQRVRALRLGVDDWITKALPSRGGDGQGRSRLAPPPPRPAVGVESGPVIAGELEIRPDQFQAFVGGSSLDLTRREFELLHLLAEAKGQVLERETIYQRVWGYAMAHGDRSVDVFIRKLRQKLEKRSLGWGYIHTHFGVGYRFDPEPAGGRASRSRRRCRGSADPPSPDAGLHKSFTAASRRDNRGAAADRPCSAIMAIGTGNSPQRLDGRLEIRPEEHAALVDGRPAQPDDAGAAAARHPGRAPAADHDPRGALRRGLGEPAPPRRPLGRRLRQPPARQARPRRCRRHS